ncbi:alpha/beta hydrolase [Persicobacter diffluens]|uniref:AB hydrolase-1 domain-containing protein n=1 Tax=Persicobacter diffluens TaxID=981 RepID=A0AAN4VYH4_9BACT|nr:hypothetical protein PEDI_16640 [Persicobacter diffluens]
MTHLHFEKKGSGKKIFITFHGFGQSAQAFEGLETFFPHYTFYHFDLFFHGKSQLHRDKEEVNQSLWKDLLTEFLEKEEIDRFDIMGFSMGGKFALMTTVLFPEKIDQITLLAPDGIKTNFWYSMSTQPKFFRNIFRYTVHHPKPFFRSIKFLQKVKLLHPSVVRFANSQMRSRRQRRQVYLSWVKFRNIKPRLTLLASNINNHGIKVKFIIGLHDKIIPRENLQPLLKYLKSDPEIVLLDAGHHHLIASYIAHLHQIQKKP